MYESPFELYFVPRICVSVLLLLLHCHRCYNFISFKSTNPLMCDLQHCSFPSGFGCSCSFIFYCIKSIDQFEWTYHPNYIEFSNT